MTRHVIALMGIVAISGCANTYIYRPDSDALAQQAVTEYTAVDLLSVIEKERENLDATLAFELDVVDRLVDVAMKRQWYGLVTSSEPLSKSFLVDIVGERKKTLGVDNFTDQQLIDLIRLEPELRLLDFQMTDANASAHNLYRVSFPRCGTETLPGDLSESVLRKARAHRPGGVEALKFLYVEYQRICTEWKEQLESTLAPFSGGQGGLLATAVSEWQNAKLALNDEVNSALAAEDELDARKSQVRQALADRERTESAVSDRVAADSKQIGELLAKIEEKGGAAGLAKTSADRIQNIDILLGAIVDAEIDEDALVESSVAESAVLAASLSSLSSDIKTLYKKRSLDPVSSLIIEKERQQVLLDMANTRIKRQQRRVDLLRQRYLAVTDELELLNTIEQAIPIAGVAELLDKPAGDALASSCRSEACGEVYRMFLKYVEIMDGVRRRLEKIDYYLIDLEHRIALDESATAIGLWNALIATPLQQLAAYHGGGVRAEAVADLFVRFTTLGGIAVGVND